MNCDCGSPGIPKSGFITTGIKSRFPEDFTIEYKCERRLKLFYKSNRTCIEGKWTGRVPKCGNY
jgi:hypothetical protein